MKILLVINANSFLVKSLAKKLKEYDSNARVDILSDKELSSSDHPYDNAYCVSTEESVFARAKFFKVFYLAWQLKKKIKLMDDDYDAVHIHYVNSIHRLIWSDLKRIAKKRIITVFGSDFYKSPALGKSVIKKVVKEADIITFSNESTRKEFSEYFGVEKERQRICFFGLSVLDEIDTVTVEDQTKFREKYSIPLSSTIIGCGYNSTTNQNLDKIIDQLTSIKSELRNAFLTFQFHGVQTAYTLDIESKLKSSDIPFKIFNNHFTDKELAVYRKSVDVFVQLQTTDQFSGAMQEHLYAGSVVITGNWLPYKILDDQNTDYIRINSFTDLATAIMENRSKNVDVIRNQAIIGSISKWKQTIEQWQSLYT